jgi:Oxidoreductase FAD-binding domain
MAAPLEDCCGLGCNNCILDRFLDNAARRPNFQEKFNLFNQKGYQKFQVKSIEREREFIYKFTFALVCDRDEPFQKDEQLLAVPVSYLMLRAPRKFENYSLNPEFEEFKEFLYPSESEQKVVPYFRSEPQRFDKGTPEIYMSRKYTPYEVNEELRTFKIIVKLEKFGKMSKYFTQLQVGSVCEFKGPFEAFSYIHEQIENYIVFTQGTLSHRVNTIGDSYQLSSRDFHCVGLQACQRNYL